MPESCDYILSADGLRLHRRTWRPRRPASAVILFAHGIGEHSGRYAQIADSLNQKNIAVIAMDYRGHGESDGKRAFIDSIDTLVTDMESCCRSATEEFRGTPLFLLGFSLGSLVMLDYLRDSRTDVNGLILVGNALGGNELLPSAVLPFLQMVAKLFPEWRVIPGLNAEELSTDREIVETYQNDPLVDHGRWRLSTLSAIMIAIGRSRQRITELSTPLLVMHGEQDKMLPVSGARFVHSKAGSVDKTLLIYPNEYHDLLNSLSREQVLIDLTAWIESRL